MDTEGRSKRMKPIARLPGLLHKIHYRADNKNLVRSVQKLTEHWCQASGLVNVILLDFFLLIQNLPKSWLNKVDAPRLAQGSWISPEVVNQPLCVLLPKQHICPSTLFLGALGFLCYTLCLLFNYPDQGRGPGGHWNEARVLGELVYPL